MPFEISDKFYAVIKFVGMVALVPYLIVGMLFSLVEGIQKNDPLWLAFAAVAATFLWGLLCLIRQEVRRYVRSSKASRAHARAATLLYDRTSLLMAMADDLKEVTIFTNDFMGELIIRGQLNGGFHFVYQSDRTRVMEFYLRKRSMVRVVDGVETPFPVENITNLTRVMRDKLLENSVGS